MVGSGHNCRPLKMFYSSISRLITRSVAGGKDTCTSVFFFCRHQIFHWKQQKCWLPTYNNNNNNNNNKYFIYTAKDRSAEYEKTAGTMLSWFNDNRAVVFDTYNTCI